MGMQNDWFIVLVAPQRELTTGWRFHREGLELHVPIVRRLVKCGGWRGKAQKVTTLAPRAMFPGYGFVRTDAVCDPHDLRKIDGVLGLLKNERGQAFVLPAAAHAAVRAKEYEEHRKFLDGKGVRASAFKPGDAVRFDEGTAYTGLLANIEKVDNGRDRVQVLLGMMKYWVPADMVIAA